MSYTIEMDEHFSVARDIEAAFNYVADFSTIQEWDHTVTSSEKISDGPVKKGAGFKLMLKFGMRSVRMDYSIVEYDFPNRVVLVGSGSGFKAIDTVLFTERGGDTHVHWHADVIFDGVMEKLAPRLEQRIVSAGTKTIQGLQNALDDNNPTPEMLPKHKVADTLVLPGMWLFTNRGYRKARKRWNPNSADIRGKHIVLTGATSGIGLSAAYDLAAKGASLTLVARSKSKADDLLQDMVRRTGNENIRIEIADMSLISDVCNLAERLLDSGKAIDVLINNAGALFNPRAETAEGIEQSFSLLLLAPYVLTQKLYPLLKQSKGRVVNVSSGGMYSQCITPNDMENQHGKYSGSVAYAKAKRGLMICTEEWAKRWAEDGISVNAMHPGWADTPGVVSALPEFYKVTKSVLRTPQEGGDTISWLASATEAGKVSGKFFLDREPHVTHVSRKTQETLEQRQALLDNLENYAQRFLKTS